MLTFDVVTSDGPCPVTLCTPRTGAGPWPAVFLIMDGFGIRPALFEMAQTLADDGYAVAVPDLLHRVGSPLDLIPQDKPREVKQMVSMMGDPAVRSAWFGNYLASAMNPAHIKTDFEALLQALDGRPEVVKGSAFGITGYCMGGQIAFRAAALFPERFAALASFHGGNLATADANSPHLGVPKFKAEVFVAGAEEDASFSPEIRQRLVDALVAAGTVHRVETWAGSRHGFAVRDSPAYKPELGERHDAALRELFARTLRR
jgi:carboxymethylenebutenolidase